MRILHAVAFLIGAAVGLTTRVWDLLTGRRKTWGEEIKP